VVVEAEEVRAGARITIGGVTLVPVVRTVAYCHGIRGSIAGFGVKEVVGVVVLSADGKRAISVSGEEVPVESFAEQVPEVARPLSGRDAGKRATGSDGDAQDCGREPL